MEQGTVFSIVRQTTMEMNVKENICITELFYYTREINTAL